MNDLKRPGKIVVWIRKDNINDPQSPVLRIENDKGLKILTFESASQKEREITSTCNILGILGIFAFLFIKYKHKF